LLWDGAVEAGFDIYAEDWAPTREPPSLFELDGTSAVTPAESEAWTAVRPGAPSRLTPLAFVDGTRRVELGLWRMERETGRTLRGLAGAYAVGATLCRPGAMAEFAALRRGRVCIWTGGLTGSLGPSAGYYWGSQSLSTTDPDKPLEALQNLMRDAEAHLAQEVAERGWQVVLDGPFSRLRSLRRMVAGYAKTHHRQLLPDDQHRQVPYLLIGERSALWALGDDRFTCYTRVGSPTSVGSPWSGVVRIEFPAFAGFDAARDLADRLAWTLPKYAGRHHMDPRAPQNLQPVRALELQLARTLGPPRLAAQSARNAVAYLQAVGRQRAASTATSSVEQP
jgi:hypothetical protein